MGSLVSESYFLFHLHFFTSVSLLYTDRTRTVCRSRTICKLLSFLLTCVVFSCSKSSSSPFSLPFRILYPLSTPVFSRVSPIFCLMCLIPSSPPSRSSSFPLCFHTRRSVSCPLLLLPVDLSTGPLGSTPDSPLPYVFLVTSSRLLFPPIPVPYYSPSYRYVFAIPLPVPYFSSLVTLSPSPRTHTLGGSSINIVGAVASETDGSRAARGPGAWGGGRGRRSLWYGSGGRPGFRSRPLYPPPVPFHTE